MRQMKDSSIPLVGSIPTTWEVRRIDSLFAERKDFCSKEEDLSNLLSVSEYYGVAKKAEKTQEDDFITRSENLEGYRRCKKNDFVMNYMLAWKGAQGTTDYEGVVSPAYAVFKPLGDMVPQFAHYLFRTKEYCTIFESFSTGIILSRLRLYPRSFLKLYAPLPSISEQRRIAAFLDDKCAEIDALTADVQKEIETLQEYRRSLITETVTKGLDPDAEMKDNGIEWIGQIPNSWRVCRLKYFGRMESGTNLTATDIDPFIGEYPVYGGNGLRGYYRQFTNTGRHVLIGRQGALAGNVHLVDGPFWATDHAVVFYGNGMVDDVYLYYMLTAMNLNQYAFDTAAQPGLAVSKICNLSMCVPPTLNEQHHIANFLNEKCAEIDSIIEIKQKQLETLAEYRKSLIYEYVTGKKEVV